jgi:hypothetical protein
VHRTTPQFWERFYALPEPIQHLARKNFALLKANPSHLPYVRLTYNYRLRLRPLDLADAATLHALLDTDESMWIYQHGYAFTLDQQREVIESRIADYGLRGFGRSPGRT